MEIKLEKSQTGIASEFYVAGELTRLGYNVTLTFGNTKAIDLLIQKENKVLAIQVKGIQTNDSICWNLDKTKITEDPNLYIVLVNLHADQPQRKPEFFVLTSAEAKLLFKNTAKEKDKRTYLGYTTIKKLNIYADRWDVFGRIPESLKDDTEWKNLSSTKFLAGYGENEPDYFDGDIKEPNPDYKKWKEE